MELVRLIITRIITFALTFFLNRWIVASVTHDDNLAFAAAFVLTSVELALAGMDKKLDMIRERK